MDHFVYPVISLIRTGKNISFLMEQSHLKVKDLQEVFAFEHPQAIYKWLRGDSLPSIDNLVVLSQLFDVPIDRILVIDEMGKK